MRQLKYPDVRKHDEAKQLPAHPARIQCPKKNLLDPRDAQHFGHKAIAVGSTINLQGKHNIQGLDKLQLAGKTFFSMM